MNIILGNAIVCLILGTKRVLAPHAFDLSILKQVQAECIHSGTCMKRHRITRSFYIKRSVFKVSIFFPAVSVTFTHV